MRKIEFYFWEGYISVAPTVINLANALAEKGHQVTIYTRTIEGFAPDPELHTNVKVYRLKANGTLRLINRGLGKVPLKIYKRELYYFKIQLAYFNSIIKSKRSIGENVLLIGIDTIGLYWANSMKKTGDSLIYLSLELSIPPDWYHANFIKYLKKKELRIHNHSVNLTLIQDKYRMDILRSTNQKSKNLSFAILTNSPRQLTGGEKNEQNYFEKNFALPGNSFKLLSAGMISEAVLSSDIAKSFGRFPDKSIYMIYHEREKIDKENTYLKTIKKYGGENLILSLTPVAYNQVYKILSSANVGLVFYNPEFGENFSNIVGASGKLAHYLKYGMPVICLDLPGFKELIEKYKCGVVISDVNQLENAVLKVRENYTSMKYEAFRCYEECYNFDYQLNKIYTEWNQVFFN